jgi:DNA processing protein
MAKINKELDDLDHQGGELIVLGDRVYPTPLAATEDAPPIMMGLGHTHLLDQNIFAIVGARNASAVGLKIAHKFTEKLGKADIIISSGLALGIDAAVHQGAIDTGTIIVLDGGADVIYPRENTEIYHGIKEQKFITGFKKRGLFYPRGPLALNPKRGTFHGETSLFLFFLLVYLSSKRPINQER